MKKVILILIAVAMVTLGQEGRSGNVITSGDDLLSVGFNLDDWSDIMPGVSVAWDHGVGFAESFTFGAQVFTNFHSDGVYLNPLFRAGYHPFAMPSLQGKVNIAPVFDPYVVVAVGPSIWLGDGDTFDSVKFTSAVGCNWMFKPNFGLWGEIGNYFVAGITFKL